MLSFKGHFVLLWHQGKTKLDGRAVFIMHINGGSL